MASEPTRREKLVMGLRLAFALTEEEAEHMLCMHDTDVARHVVAEVNQMAEPRVWALPLKWWRRGRDATLAVVAEDVMRADQENRNYDRRGHKL